MKNKLSFIVLFSLIMVLLFATNVFAGQGLDVLKKDSVRITPFSESGISVFHESPMLKEKVESGELPSVKDRLPEDPMVVQPENEIGKYGGTINLTQFSSDNLGIPGHVLTEAPLMFNRDYDHLETIPNFVKDWEFKNDGKTLILWLRKGIKWSDGKPLTVDDFLFWWKDIVQNKEITPILPAWVKPGGEMMKVDKLDKYSLSIQFSVPYYGFLDWINSYWYRGVDIFVPAHYLKQYHIKYNPDADKLAKEEGYGNWVQLFNHYYAPGFTLPKPVGRPRLSAWIVKKVTPTGRVYERNPYYWKVDSEGNQLPYIDKLKTVYVPDAETRKLKVLSGDIDYISAFLSIKDYPTFKKNEEDGGYNAWIGKSIWASRVAFIFQQQYQNDSVLAKILSDKRFRQAMSLALNRDEINEVVFLGQGVPRQFAYTPGTVPVYKEEWGKAYASYDPEQAEKILDDMGLVDSDGDGWRERPDGKPLVVNLLANSSRSVCIGTSELARDYWQEIGVKINMKAVEEATFFQRMWNGKAQIAAGFMTGAKPPWDMYRPCEITHFNYGSWLLYYDIFTHDLRQEIPDDAQAIKPPQKIIDWYEWGQMLDHVRGAKEKELYTKIGNYIAKNLPAIGTVGMAGHVGISDKDLGNLRKVGDNPSVAALRNAYMEQFYWKNADKRK